jgi:hypothetical protein
MVLGAASILVLAGAGQARAGFINFDVDAFGIPINAPPDFAQTTALTNLYAPLGVHFSGPGTNNGGAILNQLANFGVNALSPPNFLAFNQFATLSNGGIPKAPETISFDHLQSSVSIFVAGGRNADPFTLTAFDSNNHVVSTASVTTQGYAPLTVSFAGGIQRVVLNTTGDGIFVADNLSFTPLAGGGGGIPEPSTLALFALGGTALAARRWRRRKQPTA